MIDEEAVASKLRIPLEELRRIAKFQKTLYAYKRIRKGNKIRILRISRGALREVQDSVKANLLDPLPLPNYVHGWRKRRSPKTYASGHVRQAVVVNIDVKDFFPSVTAGRVCAFWERVGFSADASRLLTALTTCDNQLPQGCPTSQSIGNQILFRLNRRLHILAKKHRLNFSTLGDEFSISGRLRAERLLTLLLRILEQEGFVPSPAKVKVMYKSGPQELAGNFVNRKVSLGRRKLRSLRAVIHNCVRFGPGGQNHENHPSFREHLRGRIAQFQHVQPKLGLKLLKEFQMVNWDESTDARKKPNAR